MADMNNWFTSVGILRMAVLEVVDVIRPSNGNQKKKPSSDETAAIHCRISIRDSSGSYRRSYDTALQPCYSMSNSLKIGEEFIFDRILSSSSVSLSFRYIDMHDQTTSLLGNVAIPITRLEEDVKVRF